MWNLELFAKNLSKLSVTEATKEVVGDKSIQMEAIHLNKDIQLFEKGVDVFGVAMRSRRARPSEVYSDFTIAMKKEKGQPYDRVTMRDTGLLYSTFKTKIVALELMLSANTVKEGKDLQKAFGQFVGLDEFSVEKLVDKSKPIISEYVRKKIL
jgi:hypothetical protein